MFANGWRPGHADGGEVSDDDLHKQIIKHLLDKEAEGSDKDILDAIHGGSDEEAVPVAADETDVVVPEDGSDADVSDDEDEDEDETTKRLVDAFLAHSSKKR